MATGEWVAPVARVAWAEVAEVGPLWVCGAARMPDSPARRRTSSPTAALAALAATREPPG